jgi:hypothetical protein
MLSVFFPLMSPPAIPSAPRLRRTHRKHDIFTHNQGNDVTKAEENVAVYHRDQPRLHHQACTSCISAQGDVGSPPPHEPGRLPNVLSGPVETGVPIKQQAASCRSLLGIPLAGDGIAQAEQGHTTKSLKEPCTNNHVGMLPPPRCAWNIRGQNC